MCGILFLYDKSGINKEKESYFKNSLKTKGMQRRGPDNTSYKIFKNSSIIGHTRLSIIDLTKKSNQPLESFNKRFIISFNGEIFNYKELSYFLDIPKDKLSSFGDTRVLLELISEKGLEFTLEKINGDFSFILIDKKLSKIYAARDRYGAKPLYYFQNSNSLCFGSRIEAIHIALNKKFIPDLDSIREYFHHGVGGESKHTWFRDIKRISPGCFCEFDINKFSHLQEKKYFSNKNIDIQKLKSKDASIQEFDQCLKSSIKKRLRSDVPLSLSFSGGLDSSSILIKSNNQSPLNLYTYVNDENINNFQRIYFSENKEPHDDLKLSISLAKRYKKKQIFIYPNKNDFVENLKNCIYALESGHTSTSIDCAYQIYKNISKNHKVTMEGQGADELLCGYFNISSLIKVYDELMKFNFTNCIKLIFIHREYYKLKNSFLVFLRWLRNPFVSYLFSFFSQRNRIIKFQFIRNDYLPNKFYKGIKKTILWSILRYQRIGLTNLLQYGDALSMDNSVETRNPYLDKELCDEVYTGTYEYAISSNLGKLILRLVLKNDLPSNLLLNPSKKGFSNSNFIYFQNISNEPLSIINDQRTFSRNIWNGKFLKKYINSLYNKDGSSKKYIGKHFNTLFRILSIELWFRTFID